jgi:hypothetical protein
VAAVPEVAVEALWGARTCLGRPDTAAVLDDLSDDAEPIDFADEAPADDDDPPVSAHAIPAPPSSAAPTPKAMARPPTRPM